MPYFPTITLRDDSLPAIVTPLDAAIRTDDDDWMLAGEAVRLITERGYARDRDLVSALAELRR